MNLNDKVSSIKGIGPKKAQALNRLGIYNIEDFLYFFPRDYQDRRLVKKIGELEHGSLALIHGVVKLKIKGGFGKKQTLRLLVTDETGGLEAVFFNAQYLVNKFEIEKEYVFYGKVSKEYGKTKMLYPEFFEMGASEAQGIVPIYPLTAGITQNDIFKWQKMSNKLIPNIKETLTENIINNNKLCSINYALDNIHFPKGKEHLKVAKYRLVFDELLFLQIGLLSLKNRITAQETGISFKKDVDLKSFMEKLPYALTGAQQRVVEEICEDMESEKVMNRLVQGDVGSGKTVVAEIALYKAVKNGYQGVMMAPTELLARQHFEGLKQEFDKHHIKVALLTGSMTEKAKKEVLNQLELGDIQILVGTHALIQPTVIFKNLGLVITDEQHRFGVNQRNLLADKGGNPDILVMTATPIPRTLAVIIYGDLDISIIDELPPGRQKIETRAYDENSRGRVYSFVQEEILKGRQAYVVAPLIEESENLENVKSAFEIYEELCVKFPNIQVALLHGEMKQSEKDIVMKDFYEDKIKILVSTVVIEVGINVPNATMMVIENAERFGLAQLHQLRGRVGRGKHKSYCMLVSRSKTPIAKERIEIMVSTTNGFVIAEKDLQLRGPGEFFGVRQHGLPDLKLADLVKHIDILHKTRLQARELLESDPGLLKEETLEIRQKIIKMFGESAILSL